MVLLSLPVTDVGRVLAFFSCSLRSSLDPAVSGFLSSGWTMDLSRDPALLTLLLPGCGLTLTWVGRESQEKYVSNLSTCRDAQCRAWGVLPVSTSLCSQGSSGSALGSNVSPTLAPIMKQLSTNVPRGNAPFLEEPRQVNCKNRVTERDWFPPKALLPYNHFHIPHVTVVCVDCSY